MTNNSFLSRNLKKESFVSLTTVLILFQILSLSLVIIFNAKNLEARILYVSILIVLISCLSNIIMAKISKGDNYLIYIANMIFSIGIIMILRLNFSLGLSQLMMYIFGMSLYFITYFFMRISGDIWKNKFYFFFLLAISMFIFTLIFGKSLGGAKNWIRIGNYQIQLSEFTKIPFVLMFASFYSEYGKFKEKTFGKYYLIFATYIMIALFFLQRELGTALVFFAILICSQIAYEKNKLIILGNISLAILGLVLAYLLFDHIKVRFDIWLDPWSQINNKGYQIAQSLFAISSGGFFGTGLGLGHPNYIPLGHSDFIFASIVEEMGIFMGICIVFLFLILFYRGIKISLEQTDIFYKTLALVISVLFASQSIIMFMGVLKLIPLTGITIPFLSHGGSSLTSSFILLALLQVSSESSRMEENYEK